jgi:curved DNA-binding protein CbpA
VNSDKDYYSILGVLPNAEDIVVRAAYRALAQRYHPDHARESQEKAHSRMSELNDAFGVLSDKAKRSSYDQLRSAAAPCCGEQFNAAEESPTEDTPLESDWGIALKYYPDLATLEGRLSQFSRRLASTYRAHILETQQFDARELLAGLMENHFLRAHFGDHEKNMDFARRLILARQRKAAQVLNESIRVLGCNTDPRRVIGQIARDFNIRHLAVNKERIVVLLAQARTARADMPGFVEMLTELGGAFESDCGASQPGRASAVQPCKVEFDGRSFKFASEHEFSLWFMREVVPIAERVARQ